MMFKNINTAWDTVYFIIVIIMGGSLLLSTKSNITQPTIQVNVFYFQK